jgi:DNA-binding beta-propeller fold protein YncE
MGRKIFTIVLVVLSISLIFVTLEAQSQNYSLKFDSSIPLTNVLGRIDHMAYNHSKQYVYIAALGNNTVEVVDLKNKEAVHSIKGLKEPQGVVYIPENNSIFITNGNTGECDFFDADLYIKIKSINLSGDADNVRYDSADKKIYVGYGEGGMAVIDAVTMNLLKEIKLSGHPESFQIDKTVKKIYVNIPFQSQVEIIDIEKTIVTDSWKLIQVSTNFPMSLDETNHRLFIGCRDPAKLVVIDTENDKTIATQNIDNDVDDLYYDASTKQIILSCGSGFVEVFSQINPDSYTLKEKVPTHRGARTSLLIPELNKLIVASPSGFSAHASLLIYDIK